MHVGAAACTCRALPWEWHQPFLTGLSWWQRFPAPRGMASGGMKWPGLFSKKPDQTKVRVILFSCLAGLSVLRREGNTKRLHREKMGLEGKERNLCV